MKTNFYVAHFLVCCAIPDEFHRHNIIVTRGWPGGLGALFNGVPRVFQGFYGVLGESGESLGPLGAQTKDCPNFAPSCSLHGTDQPRNTHIHIDTDQPHTRTHAHTHTHRYIQIITHTHIRTFTHTRRSSRSRKLQPSRQPGTHTHTHTCTHTRTHTYINIHYILLTTTSFFVANRAHTTANIGCDAHATGIEVVPQPLRLRGHFEFETFGIQSPKVSRSKRPRGQQTKAGRRKQNFALHLPRRGCRKTDSIPPF